MFELFKQLKLKGGKGMYILAYLLICEICSKCYFLRNLRSETGYSDKRLIYTAFFRKYKLEWSQ